MSPDLTLTLADLVRRQLAEDGRPPSRRRVAGWIAAGVVTVDGDVVRDPAARVPPTARVGIDLDAVAEVAGAPGEEAGSEIVPRCRSSNSILDGLRHRASSTAVGGRGTTTRNDLPPLLGLPAAERSALPAGVLYADRHLVALERSAFPPGDLDALAAAVTAAFAARGRSVPTLHGVPDPSAVGSGVVLLGTSRASAERLAHLLCSGQARETLLALRDGPATGPGEAVLQDSVAPGEAAVRGLLVLREDVPPGPPPTGARDVVPPHRAVLTFKHPRSNRRLELGCAVPATFSAALPLPEGHEPPRNETAPRRASAGAP